jgi:hypothetical protein
MSMNGNGTEESLHRWRQRSLHTITCPSGQRLKIRMPGIATLLERGELPATLIPVALLDFTDEMGATGAMAAALADEKPQEEVMALLAGFTSLQRWLACKAIVAVEGEPGDWHDVTLDPDDADFFPEDDLAMVAEIVQRVRDLDAAGVRIGVEPAERWATFREEHQCDEDCEACARVLDAFSSVHMGGV